MTLPVAMPDPGLRIPADAADAMRAELPRVAGQVVDAIRAEVPSYADPFSGQMGRAIENAVALALGGFIGLVSDRSGRSAASVDQVSDAAYALGRGEARAGRSMDALLSAYRVGARVSWRDLSGSAVTAGLPADSVARFAELVFEYIDQLSATSAAGHADELATTGRVRQRYLERLTQQLLRGDTVASLEEAAERADWQPPAMLAAVVLPEARVRGTLARLDPATLHPTEQVPGLEDHPDLTVLLVPLAGSTMRAATLARLRGREAVLGPTRPWTEAQASYERAMQVVRLGLHGRSTGPEPDDEAVDTEAHLPALILGADQRARDDLRAQVLAPLRDLRPASADKLQETLRAWLLHQGRREDVAAALFVHPQTVRYRLQQLRELYGDRLEDPAWVLRLTLALA